MNVADHAVGRDEEFVELIVVLVTLRGVSAQVLYASCSLTWVLVIADFKRTFEIAL